MQTWQDAAKDWSHFKGKINTKWNKLTPADLDKVQGKKEQLAATIETRYKISRAEANKQIDAFLKAEPAKKR